ncbi:F0F1 ATP synthase subunit B [Clostridium hydrogeniformans]|uniref:F0F1 ATP synthase subunit B n=1 Tax=Clostridium hydrogeniformans TaxID=349933 RepID=UPI000552BC25|nr:F0F1 ATP synthase subunit B [Clostridium hydrogeniformans]
MGEVFSPNMLFYIFNFVILYLVLKYFLFDRVKKIMESRKERVVNDINSAKLNREQSEKLIEDGKLELKKVKEQGKSLTKTYKTKAESLYDEIVGDAKKEADAILDRAKVEIDREKHKAEDEIKSQSIELAIEMASKALQDSLDKDTHRRLIDDFIAKVGN